MADKLNPYRFFSPIPDQQNAVKQLYDSVKDLPLICPHGHVDPAMFVDPDYHFASPTDLLIIPDHYVFRMLYSQGIQLESLGIPRLNHSANEPIADPREVWQIIAEYFYLFRGTPTGIWLTEELVNVFGVTEKLTGETAQTIYDQIWEKLQTSELQPRSLYERFNIEVLCTTDSPVDTLEYHQQIKDSGWKGNILPTFRPDALINLDTPGWKKSIEDLETVTNRSISTYKSFISALEERRLFFKSMGAKATDHSAQTPLTLELSEKEAEDIFQRALKDKVTPDEATRFTAHMLVEMARMSVEDGLVMQLHIGSYRNHNAALFRDFGSDMGADIPVTSEYTNNLKPLLNRFGSDSRFTLVIMTLDESTYSRELAPLAGHYPALKLGPPWWFHDSPNGMQRYFESVMETAGLYNTVGFNDDTRAFTSIPARHDLWRRAACDWVAGLLVRHLIDEEDANEMVYALAYDLAKKTYKFS